jgi:hypothetical protein
MRRVVVGELAGPPIDSRARGEAYFSTVFAAAGSASQDWLAE